MSMVHIDERKWPDRLHWQFDAQHLGEAVAMVTRRSEPFGTAADRWFALAGHA